MCDGAEGWGLGEKRGGARVVRSCVVRRGRWGEGRISVVR